MTAATWESNDTGHRAVLRTAGEFDTGAFRRKSISKGVEAIMGKHSSNDSVLKIQSLVFDKDHFETVGDARKWLSDNSSVDKEYDSRTGTKLDSKGISEVGITKRLTMLQSAGGAVGKAAEGGVRQPTAEQLRMINTLTRSPKTASEVAVFPVLAANDIIDRDVDRFTPDTIRGFMDLEGPLNPVGKSFMVGHDYSKLPVGRIFDGGAVEEDGVNWLKLWTYMPNTEQYKSFLENVDFGIYWAVSVGVMLGGATCSVGEPHEWGWHPMVCSAGHMKSERYDALSSGSMYDMPDTNDAGVLCWRNLEQPQDFYELSQVYLGAQYMAAYDEKVAGAVSKSFDMGGAEMAKGLELYESDAKILTLTADEAAELPHPFPDGSKIAKAADAGTEIEDLEDGSRKFTDEDGLVWVFDANGDETCLGKAADEDDEDDDDEADADEDVDDDSDADDAEADDEDDEEDDTEKSPQEVAELLGKVSSGFDVLETKAANDPGVDPAVVSGAGDAIDLAVESIGTGDYASAYGYLCAAWDLIADSCDPLLDNVIASVGAPDPEEEPTLENMDPEEGEVKQADLLKAVRTAKLPGEILASAAEPGADLGIVLNLAAKSIRDLEAKVLELEPMAVMGERAIQEKRADAIHWYTMATKEADSDKGVDTTKIERLLTLCGTNAELIEEQRDMYRDLARAKFPEAVRRSTHPDAGIGERHEVSAPDLTAAPGENGATRIHG